MSPSRALLPELIVKILLPNSTHAPISLAQRVGTSEFRGFLAPRPPLALAPSPQPAPPLPPSAILTYQRLLFGRSLPSVVPVPVLPRHRPNPVLYDSYLPTAVGTTASRLKLLFTKCRLTLLSPLVRYEPKFLWLCKYSYLHNIVRSRLFVLSRSNSFLVMGKSTNSHD